ncbi:molybdopterin biosynthesis protein [Oceanicola granulosus HTCC2516]|uniref:Molybdopterin biosynthesis protein n=1 Tax=Oceanicola granulosus (strain ATCC BAA-861 / DSM 15982 / KCTC 12143 / HTCC2516) TaxID=314256 RepID=Q2CAJ2_OCEGH|nr:molybdopterin-binding protein [Oceanicola granulosus]EAR49682.1 molybdopterin biosynthesis protein [Oceanicola granulosus HTCC2516]
MRFGPVPPAEASGTILAHSLTVGAARWKKGRALDEDDAAALAAAGLAEVTVARLEPGDVGEDAAAARLAEALAGDGLRLSRAATGRVNLFAPGPGVARVEAGAVAALNGIDPMITVATVPPWQRCAEGTMVATVKIISYGVPEAALAQACATGAGALGFAAPVLRSAALIETEVALGREQSGKGAEAMRERLARLGIDLAIAPKVAHDVAPLAEALAGREEDLVLVLTGSATSDAADVGPAALRAAGGELVRFGMPVDPGNLLFLGDIAGRPVIGLPGCARSPALNGADWVLERVVCGVPVGPDDIAAMGVGGLLKEIPTRPRPRDHRR